MNISFCSSSSEAEGTANEKIEKAKIKEYLRYKKSPEKTKSRQRVLRCPQLSKTCINVLRVAELFEDRDEA